MMVLCIPGSIIYRVGAFSHTKELDGILKLERGMYELG